MKYLDFEKDLNKYKDPSHRLNVIKAMIAYRQGKIDANHIRNQRLMREIHELEKKALFLEETYISPRFNKLKVSSESDEQREAARRFPLLVGK